MKKQSDTTPATEHKRVLFLCSGNYYRSRLAEILFNHEAAAAGIPWVADSRGMLAAGELKGLSEHAASYLKVAGLDALLAEKPRDPLVADIEDLTGSDLAGSTRTGNSSNGLLYTAITQTVAGEFTASAYPFRIVDVVRDTQVVLGTATYSSGGNSTTVVATANLTFAVPVGAQLAWVASNGQLVDTGSFVTTAITANNTANIVISAAPLTSITGATTQLVLVQYPEALVKFNWGAHGYMNSISNL